LLASESGEISVSFVANFRVGTARKAAGFTHIKVAQDPYSVIESGEAAATNRIVAIHFEGLLAARFAWSHSDHEVLNPDEFDSSAINPQFIGGGIDAYLKEFDSLWAATGLCPNPGAYVVEASKWRAELNQEGYEHFVVTGHDAYVEVLARSWKWQELKPLPEHW